MSERTRFENWARWAALGVSGGVVVGVVDAWLNRGAMQKIHVEIAWLNRLVNLLVGGAFYSQVFFVVLIVAGAFFLFVSPWPRRARRGETADALALAVLLVATGALYAGIALNAWAPGIGSWQSMAANGGMLALASVALIALYAVLAKTSSMLARVPLVRIGIVVGLVVSAVIAGPATLREPKLPGRDNAKIAGPNVLLVTVDTLRADHLSAYGYDKIQTPNLDRLASDGALFSRHLTASSWTLPTIASLHTGIHPDVHGTYRPETRLDTGFTTMAEAFGQRGYATAAYLTNAYLESRYAMDQGFDVYQHARDHHYDPPYVGLSLYRFLFSKRGVRHSAEQVTWRVLRFLKKHRDRRFFLWVHYIDPHLPYGDWYIERLPAYARDLQAERGVHVNSIDEFLKGKKTPTADDIRHLNGAYDAEILYLDRQIGRLRDGLARLGLDEDTLIVLTGDHGEEFYDHESWFHGYTLYNESVHVPLMIAWPGTIAPGRRIDIASGTVDIAPTLTDLCRAETPSGFVGRSLKPWLLGETPPVDDPPVLSALSKWSKSLRGVHTRRWDLLLDLQGDTAQLFDAENDPTQTRDVAAEHPEVALRLRAVVDRWKKEAPRYRKALATAGDTRVELDQETRLHLRALGYMN